MVFLNGRNPTTTIKSSTPTSANIISEKLGVG